MKPKHVVVALRMAGIAGQDKLNGIFEYLSQGPRWNLAIYRTRHEFSAATVRKEIARGATGFLVGLPDAEDAFREIAASGLPTILLNVSSSAFDGRPNVVTVRSNAEAVGRTAAHTLLKQGVYKSYGYVGYPTDDDWSRERGRAYRDALQEAGFVGRMFDATHFQNRTEDQNALLKWIRELPKPCGILAACDDRAFEVIEVCNNAGIAVPDEVGVLGVNNDPILCENSQPTISSVQPDFRREGYLAAQLLNAAMVAPRRGRAPATTLHLVGVKQVVLRDSTAPDVSSGKLVQNTLAFLAKCATRKVSVAEVAQHMRVSRSLLDLRFREIQHETVHDAAIRIRLAEVQRRLRTTKDRIEKISRDCGWNNLNTLKGLFRKTFGCSMRAWRQQNAGPRL